ncbi:MAG: PASTA domain-containing protein [Candidatus Eisenbacteria bacterium]
MYLSSFAGFAPAQAPRLVGVIVIDEPRGKRYYGGEVAAPVFREVLLDLMRLPEGPFEARGGEIASRPPAPAAVTVPDLRLLPPAAAERRLASYGLRARFQGQGARVLAQIPAAGHAAERGASIAVWLSPPDDSASRVMPDLSGLAVREALRRLAPLGLRPRIEGRGLVVRQTPAAGVTLTAGREARLWCQPGVAPLAVATAGLHALPAVGGLRGAGLAATGSGP